MKFSNFQDGYFKNLTFMTLPVTKAMAAAIKYVPTPTSCFTLLLTTCDVQFSFNMTQQKI